MSKYPKLALDKLETEVDDLYEVLNGESDLAAILIGTSFADACLRSILEHALRKGSTAANLLDPPGGALSEFTSRARLCYALELIAKPTLEDLELVAQVRNQVAHLHVKRDFSSPEIVKICRQFRYVKFLSEAFPETSLKFDRTRNQFVLTIIMLSNTLMIKALEQRKKSGRAESPRAL